MNGRTILATVLLVFFFSSTFSLSSSAFGDLVIIGKAVKDPFYSNEFPVITGRITDETGKPVSGAEVQVTFASAIVTSVTTADGTFKIQSTELDKPGFYMISVIATKQGYGMNIGSTSYTVEDPPPLPMLELPEVDIENVQSMVENGITKNPIALLLQQQIEIITKQQQEQEKKRKEIEARNKFIEEQRSLAEESLEKDIKRIEKETNFYDPRKAYERFISDVDKTVQSIFWGQFNFTEKKSAEGHAAKMSALESGKTSAEAMKIFQRKAAVSRSQLNEVNDDLNVKYGFTKDQTQQLLDKQWKFPSKGR